MAVSSRQKGQNESRHDRFSYCTYRVEALGGMCQHWNEEMEKESAETGYKREEKIKI